MKIEIVLQKVLDKYIPIFSLDTYCPPDDLELDILERTNQIIFRIFDDLSSVQIEENINNWARYCVDKEELQILLKKIKKKEFNEKQIMEKMFNLISDSTLQTRIGRNPFTLKKYKT